MQLATVRLFALAALLSVMVSLSCAHYTRMQYTDAPLSSHHVTDDRDAFMLAAALRKSRTLLQSRWSLRNCRTLRGSQRRLERRCAHTIRHDQRQGVDAGPENESIERESPTTATFANVWGGIRGSWATGVNAMTTIQAWGSALGEQNGVFVAAISRRRRRCGFHTGKATRAGRSWSSQRHAGVTLMQLLLAGIEPNPGPAIMCGGECSKWLYDGERCHSCNWPPLPPKVKVTKATKVAPVPECCMQELVAHRAEGGYVCYICKKIVSGDPVARINHVLNAHTREQNEQLRRLDVADGQGFAALGLYPCDACLTAHALDLPDPHCPHCGGLAERCGCETRRRLLALSESTARMSQASTPEYLSREASAMTLVRTCSELSQGSVTRQEVGGEGNPRRTAVPQELPPNMGAAASQRQAAGNEEYQRRTVLLPEVPPGRGPSEQRQAVGNEDAQRRTVLHSDAPPNGGPAAEQQQRATVGDGGNPRRTTVVFAEEPANQRQTAQLPPRTSGLPELGDEEDQRQMQSALARPSSSRASVRLPAAAARSGAAEGNVEDDLGGQRACPIIGCEKVFTSRVGPALREHMNTRHPPASRKLEDTTEELMNKAKVHFCETCGEAVCNAKSAISQHKCGMFSTKNSRVKELNRQRTQDIRPPVEKSEADRLLMQDAKKQATNKEMLDVSDEAFFGTRPKMDRFLRRRNWKNFADDVDRLCLGGYGEDTLEGRMLRQFKFLQYMRQKKSVTSGARKAATVDAKPAEPVEGGVEAPPQVRPNGIEALVEIGALSRAVQRMMSTSVPKVVDDACKAVLRKLHPPSAEIEGLEGLEQHAVSVSEEEVTRVVRSRLSRGSSPGLDGWTREMLLPIITNRATLKEFTLMISDIANGRTSQQVKDRLMGCPLIALDKPDGGTRPIAMESVIIKLVAHIAMAHITADAWSAAFPNSQYGVGPEANVERAVHEIRAKIHAGRHAIAVDCTNAYNTVSREAIVARLRANPGLWPIYRLSAWSLRHTKLMVMSDGKCVMELSSQSGVRQGSVLGPVLFSLAVQPILNKINSTCEAEASAYLDDITITANSSRAANQAFKVLEAELLKIGLVVNAAKTFALAPTGEPLMNPDIKQTDGLVKLLGAAAYLPDLDVTKVAEFVSKQMGKHDRFFEALDATNLRASSKMQLLQKCGTGRPTFLLRTHTPEATAEAASNFDARMERSLKLIVGEDAQLCDIASLPCKDGGLGLRTACDMTEIAYVSRKTGAQKIAADEVNNVRWTGIQSTMTDREREVMNSYGKVHMRNIQCTDEAFKLACRERLFLPTAHATARCRCGEPLNTVHVHSCTRLAEGRYHRHDKVKMILNRWAERRGYATRVEPSHLLAASRGRPDLTILLPSGDIHVDVTVTYIGAVAGRALARRAAEKRKKYEELGDAFYPFVIGHTGEMHATADAVLAMLVPYQAERDEARAELRAAVLDGNYRLLCAALS